MTICSYFISQYRNCSGERRREADWQTPRSHASWQGPAAALGSSTGPSSSSREQRDHWERDLICKPESHLLAEPCTLGKGTPALPGASPQEPLDRSNIHWKRRLLTFLLGTHMGVPCFTWPASTTTPITIGSRELKMNWGSIFILQGNTAICLEDDKEKAFWNRYWNSVHDTNSSAFSHTSWAFILGASLGKKSSRKKILLQSC